MKMLKRCRQEERRSEKSSVENRAEAEEIHREVSMIGAIYARVSSKSQAE